MIVKAKNLKKFYGKKNPFPALKGISLEIEEGEILAILGPSGCGKTTLLNCLSGLDTPTEGEVLVLGKDITKMKEEEKTKFRAQNMGFIFQFFNLIPVLTAVENVEIPLLVSKTYPVGEVRKKANEWLERLHIEHRAKAYPNEMSGGEQQRVAIARALINNPKIVWADEPTGALDTKNSEEIMNIILEMNKEFGTTFVIVTHDPNVAEKAHRIIRMDSGKIVEEKVLRWDMYIPLLIEDFFDEIPRYLDNPNALIEYVEDNYERIDDPLLNDPEVKAKLQDFYNYIVEMRKISEERITKRMKYIPGMIKRFKRMHLVYTVEKKEGLKPLDTPVKYIKGVGPKRSQKLGKLGISTLEDLLEFFPRDYEDRRKLIPISLLKEGEKVVTKGVITNIEKTKRGNLTIISAVLSDGIYQLLLKWFNQDYMENILKTFLRKEVYVYGTVKKGFYGALEVQNPEIEILKDNAREIFPIYPLTEGLNQNVIRNLLKENLYEIYNYSENLPDDLRDKRDLLDIYESYTGMHFPKSMYHQRKSRFRLAYEEILYLQLAFLYSRKNTEKIGGIPKEFTGKYSKKLIGELPFELTNAQKRVYEEIKNDLQSEKPMNRLLQGDVGSGKTIVAELAILDNYEAGFQSAVMAPTSILAIQHFKKMYNDLVKFGIKVALLIGATSNSEKVRIKNALKDGDIDVVIGTHALIQEDVKFKNLGFVIIDEQHRFGVEQRKELISKGKVVDTLVMTATPIPRTLSLAVYGDLDVSIIDEMPKGRKPVKTFLVHQSKIEEVYKFVRSEIEEGGQAYIVYPLIDDSDKLAVKAATTMYESLTKNYFPEIPMGLIHGKMSDSEKDEVMYKFSKGEIKILVSTTVIEVGIDVPNATVMVIENAERFGLAQLHQLRGRVGRSSRQSYCYLTVGDVSRETWERLQFFASTNDGFKISEFDLKLRGPGEFLGVRQHGLPEFKVADIVNDVEIMAVAREDAEYIIKNAEQYEFLLNKVKEIYRERLKLLEIG